MQLRSVIDEADEAAWSKWLCCERCKNRNPSEVSSLKVTMSCSGVISWTGVFVSFFGGNIKKKFHDSKMRTRTCAWKKSHLRIKNSWRLFLAGHNHPGQQTFHLYTSPLWLSQGFATFKKGASHRCIQFGVGPETNPRCFQKRCWREGPPGLVVVVGKGKMFNQNMTCLVLGVALSLNLQVINVFFGVI